MFFLISKILSCFISPITWITALLLYAWLSKNDHLKKKFLKTAVILFLLFSNPFLFDEVMRLWEVPAVASESLPEYDAGIVLGTILHYDVKLDKLQFLQQSDRLFQAVELYKKAKIKKIIYCGGTGSLMHPEEREGEWIKRYLVLIGLPEQDIVIENYSRNTHENAAFTKPVLEKVAPGGKYLLITSGYHLRRAKKCFEKEGIAVDVYCTDRMSGPRKFEIDNLLIPNAYVLANWYALNHELLGYLSYKIAGYI
jgi:uncharacterized SAM-binding protein YcdF (DUF218 family)